MVGSHVMNELNASDRKRSWFFDAQFRASWLRVRKVGSHFSATRSGLWWPSSNDESHKERDSEIERLLHIHDVHTRFNISNTMQLCLRMCV